VRDAGGERRRFRKRRIPPRFDPAKTSVKSATNQFSETAVEKAVEMSAESAGIARH
jgi:hypothetical protein